MTQNLLHLRKVSCGLSYNVNLFKLKYIYLAWDIPIARHVPHYIVLYVGVNLLPFLTPLRSDFYAYTFLLFLNITQNHFRKIQYIGKQNY